MTNIQTACLCFSIGLPLCLIVLVLSIIAEDLTKDKQP